MPRSKGSFLRAKNKVGNGDFVRQKKKMRKIGYRSGDTKINVKSRSLQMTEQSIVSDKGDIVSSRNLTLPEVLRQCDHHNYKNRMSALDGLQEIFQEHPQHVLPNLQGVLNASLALMVDIEAPVRSKFRQFLAFLLSTLRRSVVLTPFMSLIVAYVKSALTNLNADVRWSVLGPLHQLLRFDLSLLDAYKTEVVPLLIRLMRASKTSIETAIRSSSRPDAGKGNGQAGRDKKKKKSKKTKYNYGLAIACVHLFLSSSTSATTGKKSFIVSLGSEQYRSAPTESPRARTPNTPQLTRSKVSVSLDSDSQWQHSNAAASSDSAGKDSTNKEQFVENSPSAVLDLPGAIRASYNHQNLDSGRAHVTQLLDVGSLTTPTTPFSAQTSRGVQNSNSAAPTKESAASSANGQNNQSFILAISAELLATLGDLWLQGEVPANRLEEIVENLELLLAIGTIYAHVGSKLLQLTRSGAALVLRPSLQVKWQDASQMACTLLSRMSKSFPLRFEVIRKNTGRRSDMDGDVASMLLRVNAATCHCIFLSKQFPSVASAVVTAPQVKLPRHKDGWRRFWAPESSRNASSSDASQSGNLSARVLSIAQFVASSLQSYHTATQQQPADGTVEETGRAKAPPLSSSDLWQIFSILEQVCSVAQQEGILSQRTDPQDSDEGSDGTAVKSTIDGIFETVSSTFIQPKTQNTVTQESLNVCSGFFHRWLSASPYDQHFSVVYRQLVSATTKSLPRLLWRLHSTKNSGGFSVDAMLETSAKMISCLLVRNVLLLVSPMISLLTLPIYACCVTQDNFPTEIVQ